MPRRYRHKSKEWTKRKVTEAKIEGKYPLRRKDYLEEVSLESEVPVQEPGDTLLDFSIEKLKPKPELVPELVALKSNRIKKVFNAIRERVVHWRNKESA